MKNRKCEECGNPVFGRADKKFCDDNCRNSFNNRMNAPATNFVRNVNNTLGRNRRILIDLKVQGGKTHRDNLLKKGFDFDYYTSSYTKSGQTYKFCYDHGYLLLKEGLVLLVHKEE